MKAIFLKTIDGTTSEPILEKNIDPIELNLILLSNFIKINGIWESKEFHNINLDDNEIYIFLHKDKLRK